MTLDEACAKLGARPLDDWRSGGELAWATGRRTGSTLHMLIEFALDTEECLRRHRRFVDFAIVCSSPHYARALREQLRAVYDALALSVLPDNKLVITSSPEPPRGLSLRSWAVFCDFSAKQSTGLQPNVWPLERIRSLKSVASGWSARDRDGRQITLLTDEGKCELLDAATCPITVEKDDEPLVSYPPFVFNNGLIRLTGPFAL